MTISTSSSALRLPELTIHWINRVRTKLFAAILLLTACTIAACGVSVWLFDGFSQTETPQAAKVQAVNRMMAANNLVRMRLAQRIPVPGWVDASEGVEIVMQDRHALLNAAPHNDADARV